MRQIIIDIWQMKDNNCFHNSRGYNHGGLDLQAIVYYFIWNRILQYCARPVYNAEDTEVHFPNSFSHV